MSSLAPRSPPSLSSVSASLRVRGVTEASVLQSLLEADLRHFVFDANPLSLNFVPNHLMRELAQLLAQSPNQKWALNFNESRPDPVRHYLELLAPRELGLPNPWLETHNGQLASLQIPSHEFGAHFEPDSREQALWPQQCRFLLLSQGQWKGREDDLARALLGATTPLCLIVPLAPFERPDQLFFWKVQGGLDGRPWPWLWEMKITSELESDYRRVDLKKLHRALGQLAQAVAEI